MPIGTEAANKAEWTAAKINDLPDAAFLHVESGGEKDDDGKTTPRALRHFPYMSADGSIDLPHLRNAIARIPQSEVGDDALRAKLQKKAQGILERETAETATAEKSLARRFFDAVATVLARSTKSIEAPGVTVEKRRDAWGVHYVVREGDDARELATIVPDMNAARYHGAALKEFAPTDCDEAAWDAFVERVVEVAVEPEEPESFYSLRVMKAAAEKQIVWGVVAVPDEVMAPAVDGFTDVMRADAIEDAAHAYMLERAVKGTHAAAIDAVPVESYIAPVDFTVRDTAGAEQAVKAGSWVLAVKVRDAEEWAKVKDGGYMEFSLEGPTRRRPLD